MTEITIKSPAKSAIQYGVLFGVLMVLEFMITYTMDIDPISNPNVGRVMNFFNYLILPVVFITIVCNNYKKSNFGFISLSECLKAGVTLCVIAALIFVLFSVVFGLIFPEFIEETISKIRSVTIQQNPEMTKEQLDMSLTFVRKFMEPAIAVPVTLVIYCLLGLIYSVIIGLIVRKDKPVAL